MRRVSVITEPSGAGHPRISCPSPRPPRTSWVPRGALSRAVDDPWVGLVQEVSAMG